MVARSEGPNNNLVWKAPYGGDHDAHRPERPTLLHRPTGEKLNEQERVVCLDADTGKLKWEHKFNVFYTDIVSDRLGWTTLVGDPETGYVYAHGMQGLFFCFDKTARCSGSTR